MAQKKPTNTKKPSDSKKTEPKRSAPARSKPHKTAPVYVPDMLARGIGAGVCVFVAVLLALGLFGNRAVVIDLLCGGVKGLLGYGLYALPAVLVWAALLLLLRRSGPVRARLWCLGISPVLLAAVLHLFLSPYAYQIGTKSIRLLWIDGQRLLSGGVLGGFLSVSFASWFSRAGAALFLILALLVLLAVAARLTPAKLLALYRSRQESRLDRYEYDEDDRYDDVYEDDRDELPLKAEETFAPFESPSFGGGARRRAADLPLDDVPPRRDEAAPAKKQRTAKEEGTGLFEGAKRAFFSRKTNVKRPDEVLDELAHEDALAAEAPAAAPIPPAATEPPVWGAPPAGQKEPTRSQKRAEIKKEADEVAVAIDRDRDGQPVPYTYPSLELLTAPSGEAARAAHEELEGTLDRLGGILTSFGIDGHVVGAVQGPSVTRYEVSLEQGVRLNKLTNLSDDVALALGVSRVRIAPVPGKISVVGIEVPNKVVTPVPIREVLASPAFVRHKSSVAFAVGKDIGGNYIVGDCSKLPHMLIAGTTGSGKSVCINSLLTSLLYKSTPEEVRLIMVDPKMVELGVYNGIPHLLIPVVTDPKKAAGALQWAVVEMMKRYRLFSEAGVRDLASYNQWAKRQENVETMPKVVVVIDELADLMLVAAKEVEESICRVAQMGRAAGMHLVIATQRPSADVITGLMKANIPSRVAFAVASSLESRIILDTPGAEKLVGKGDMLWSPLGAGKPLRVQGCFISDEEVAAVVGAVKQNSGEDYDDAVMEQIEQHMQEAEKKGRGSGGAGTYPAGDGPDEDRDELFSAAVDVTLDIGQASVSMLQRRLKLGYARAARLMDQMEQEGIVGPSEGSKPRQILITKDQWAAMQGGSAPETDDAVPFDEGPDEET